MVKVSGVNFSHQHATVFKDFDFELSKRIGIIRGPSGSGKTTLLKILHGVLEPKSIDEFLVPQRSFLVLQDDNLAPWLTGTENLTIFLRRPVEELKTHPLFPLVEDILHKRAYEMSFGQRRIVELFRTFVADTDMFLLDEPMNYIDPKKRLLLLNFLKSEQCPQVPIIMTAHFTDNVAIDDAEFFEFDGEPPFSNLRKIKNNGV